MKISTIFWYLFSFYRSQNITQVVLQMGILNKLEEKVVFYFTLIGKKIHK